MYRQRDGVQEVLLVHPGGPFWAKKDLGAWSIPKGEYSADEDPLDAAKREFEEETGVKPVGRFTPLKPITQGGGKTVKAWVFEGDCDVTVVKSNTFSMEWPPHSGTQQEFPEIDCAEWFSIETAKQKILKGQVRLIEELEHILAGIRE